MTRGFTSGYHRTVNLPGAVDVELSIFRRPASNGAVVYSRFSESLGLGSATDGFFHFRDGTVKQDGHPVEVAGVHYRDGIARSEAEAIVNHLYEDDSQGPYLEAFDIEDREDLIRAFAGEGFAHEAEERVS